VITDIITPAYLKANYLYGIDLSDDDGNDFPDSMFELSIDTAIDVIEAELSIVLRGNKTVQAERHDTRDFEAETYYLMHLDHRPVLDVQSFGIKFGSFAKSDLPLSWVHFTNKLFAQLQILPGPEGIEGFAFYGTVPIIGINVLSPREYTPLIWTVDYTAGWETELTGTVSVSLSWPHVVTGTDTLFTTELKKRQYIKLGDEVRRVSKIVSDTELEVDADFSQAYTAASVTLLDYPFVLMDAICLVASLLPLDTAGDLIIGAGISSMSLSMDGISQSIQTTSGVENSGYGARAIQYRKRLEFLIQQAKGRYRMVRMFAI
jgi:hypothetical protein